MSDPNGAARANAPAWRRLRKTVWVFGLAIGKMREGPGPWLRAVRRGLFDLLPTSVKAAWARRAFAVPDPDRQRIELATGGVEQPGLVSVILPVYNQADLLTESIESVLQQTYQHFELIILDDGSTDDIDTVFARYRSHPKIRLLRQPNLTLPRALTNAFRFARGEFRTWTSADNLMEPAQLERLVAFLRAHPTTAMVYADYIVIGADGEPLRGSDFRQQNRSSPDSPIIRLPRSTETLNLLQDNFLGACFLYRGWVGRCIGSYSKSLGVEDYDYWMRINAAFDIAHLGTDETLYRYRWHDNSLNARAKELSLFERGEQLLTHERQRAGWRAEAFHEYPLTATNQSAPGKQLLLCRAGELQPEALGDLPDELTIALEWSAAERSLAYRWAGTLRDPRLVHLTDDPATALALSLLTDRVFARPPEVQAFAKVHANELVCARRGPIDAPAALPTPWTQSGATLRLLLQADDFVQGGLECVMLDQAKALHTRGFTVSLLVLGSTGPMIEQARSAGIEILALASKTAAAYADLLRDGTFDLVLAHHSVFGADVAREHNVPFVQTLHNTYHWFYPDEIERWRSMDAATTAYVHVSANVALFAHERLGLAVDKSIIIENGIELPDRTPEAITADRTRLREEYGIGPDDYVYLNVASIYPPKSQIPIAHALAAARHEDSRIKVVLLGRTMDEGYERELHEAIDAAKLGDAIILAGYHQNPEPFFAMADAFLLPSYWEGCSLAVAEALVRDLPCVLSDVGAARQQLRPGEGVLVAPPFDSVETLDFTNLKESLAQPREGFLSELAAALVSVAGTPRLSPSAERRERFDFTGVAERYARILHWIESGGDPAAARPFAWADWRNSTLLQR